MKLTAQLKIILLVVAFLIFAVLMFMFGYGIMSGRTASLADSVAQRRLELDVLQREQKSFEQGKIDLAELEKSAYPPEDLFSSDTKLVKEIQQLEETAAIYSLEMELSVSGTAKDAVKVRGTTGELYSIPYKITLEGSFDDIMRFMQRIEHMPFITHVRAVSATAVSSTVTRMVISPEFFIKK